MKRGLLERLSIKWRITLWYTALLAVICAAVVLTLVSASDRAAMAYYTQTLESASIIIQDEMKVELGLLEIDDDINDVPNVYASLFDEDGNLIYGRLWVSLPFEEGVVRLAHERNNDWYIYDTYVAVPGHESLWLRVHMSSNVSGSVRASVMHEGFWALAALAVLAVLGGYFLTARAFFPVQRMTDVARSIAGGEDLSARVPLEPNASDDELSALAQTINDMLSRLEQAFGREMQFTADAAHELRTPLNRMITQGEYALSLEDAQEKDEAVFKMLEGANDMNALISQLLLLARMDAGQLPMAEECELSEMAVNIAEDMLPLMEEKRMTLRIQTDACLIRGNRSILSRMLINLLDNAVRYGREGGEIAVTLQRKADEVILIVRNEGEGLSEEELGHVFTRFWRADGARSTNGTGVGLALVGGGAKAHGGSASAQSVKGEYAEFIITIPMKK